MSFGIQSDPSLWKCKQLQVLKHHTSDVTALDFGAKFYLASVSSDKSIAIWEWTPGLGYTQAPFSPLTAHNYAITKVKFSPDGNSFVTSAYDGNIIHWNLKIGQDDEINFSSVYGTRDNSTRDYKLVSCGNDDNLLKLWILSYDLARGRVSLSPLASLQGHTSAVTSVRFNHKSSLLVSGSMDKTVKLWDVPSLTCIKTLESHTRYVTCCTFSCDDSLLASGSNDKTVTIWDMRGNLGVDVPLNYCC
ncbi:uncharacterized protein LOC103510053, partial [Diaphorina citri]|uniref:Uncharacterized protein LOC103510053 n=1 Tax=Diaphorina citri TaxID=121845 RepID=A0A3Q0IUS6_DIACI